MLKGIVSVLRAANAQEDTQRIHHIVERAFHYLNQTLAERTSLDDMAAQLRINKHYLCHLFREHTGTTLVHYKNSRRIHQAKKMLIHTQASLLDIALQVGFDSAAYFSAWFKKLEGVTPGTYRRRSQSADQDDVARGE